MDRLEHYIEEMLSLSRDVDLDAGQVVEVRNTPGTSEHEVDGEELVSFINVVLSQGLHRGLTSWDVLEQVERIPETAHVYLSTPSSFVAGSSTAGSSATDVDSLYGIPDLDPVLSQIVSSSEMAADAVADETPSPTGSGPSVFAAHARRPSAGISMKFVRQLATMAKKFSPSAPPSVRARVFLRCALNMRSLTAVIEALCSRPQLGRSFYEEGYLFRNPYAVKTFLETLAPIGGPCLRVRAAASLFQLPTDTLLKRGLDFDAVSDLIDNSGASLAAEKAARNSSPDAAEGVALLCATVNDAKEVLRTFPVMPAYMTVASVDIRLELMLRTDQQLGRAGSLPPDGGDAAASPAPPARRRTATIAPTTMEPEPEPVDDGSSVIVVQRRKRAGTVRGGPKAKKSTARRMVHVSSGNALDSPPVTSAAYDTTAASRSRSPQPASETASPDPPLGRTRRAATIMPSAASHGHTRAHASKSTRSQSPSARRPPAEHARRSAGDPAPHASPAWSVASNASSSTPTLAPPASQEQPRTRSPMTGRSPARTERSLDAAVEPYSAVNLASVVEFEEEERESLANAQTKAKSVEDRIAKIEAFVAGRAERERQRALDLELLLTAYEDAVSYLYAQALARTEGRERELMATHDFDSPPEPPKEDRDTDDLAGAPVVAPSIPSRY